MGDVCLQKRKTVEEVKSVAIVADENAANVEHVMSLVCARTKQQRAMLKGVAVEHV